MNFKDIFKKNKPIIVAEIGNNHEGNFDRAIRLIDKAKEAGADAVKFQTYKLDNYYNKIFTEKKKYKRLKKFQLSFDQFEKLSLYANKKKIIFFSTPFDLSSAIFLNKIQKLFKISSGDNNYIQLIQLIKSFNKPVILSTGLIEYPDIKKITNLFSDYAYKNKFALLHCISKYPSFNKDLNLNSIKFLKKKFPQFEIGYSDHSLGVESCKIALTLGSFIIEKHFTLNKNFSNFHDHQISANLKEMSQLVEFSKNVQIILGKFEKKITTEEMKNLKNLRRSFYASTDIKIGDSINTNNAVLLRPYQRLSINDINFFKKKLVITKLKKNSLIEINFLKKL